MAARRAGRAPHTPGGADPGGPPRALGEWNRGRHSHSTAPLGATRAPVSQSDRKPYWAIGGEALDCMAKWASPAPLVFTGPPRAARLRRGLPAARATPTPGARGCQARWDPG